MTVPSNQKMTANQNRPVGAPPGDTEYSRWRALLAGRRLPLAVVDLDAFDRNLRRVVDFARGKPIRLATKSIRVPELIGRALKSGPAFRGLMCYSAEEAVILADLGFNDLLVAYPTVQPSDLSLLRNLHEKGRSVALVVDSKAQMAAVAKALQGCRTPFRIVIEMDMSLHLFSGLLHLGVRRSPNRTVADLERVINHARPLPELKIAGVMGYEAQVAGLTDRNPFKRLINPIAGWIRSISMKRVARFRAQIARTLSAQGISPEIFNGGGTGSLNFAAGEEALTEVTAGSALFCPHLFDYFSNIQFEPACFFALQAVRMSDEGFVTCQGGGYIASGEPGWDRVPLPHLPRGLELISTEACGEVQTPLRLSREAKDAGINIGDPILFRHAKAGELMERFEECLLVSDGKVVGTARTYRGLNRCFF